MLSDSFYHILPLIKLKYHGKVAKPMCTFDFKNPLFTSLYHKNSCNRTDFYSDGSLLVLKTVLLEESLYDQFFPYLSLSFLLPKENSFKEPRVFLE